MSTQTKNVATLTESKLEWCVSTENITFWSQNQALKVPPLSMSIPEAPYGRVNKRL